MSNQWFRLYHEFAVDPKVQVMTEALQRRYVMALCLRCNGPVTLRKRDEIALYMRITVDEWDATRDEFINRGLFTPDGDIAAWEKRQFISDLQDRTAAERQRRYRERVKQKQAENSNGNAIRNVTPSVTPPLRPEAETETETEKRIEDSVSTPKIARANGKDFERFWEHWPVKRNKRRARDVFVRKKFEITDVDLLIEDVERRKLHDPKWKQGFIPHCSTYLNGERWEDEYHGH